MTQFINPFVFDPAKSTEDNLAIAAKFMRASTEANEGLGKWLLSTAVPFNDPEAGIVAADNWTKWLETQISLFLTKSVELVGFAADASMFRLSGSSKLANYYKRISGAMKLNGDLTQLLTVTACEKYSKEIRDKIKDDGEAAQKRDQLKVIAKRKGLVEGTPEFNEFVETGMGNVVKPVATALGGSPAGDGHLADTEPGDEFDELGKRLAAGLRAFAREVSLTQARQMAEGMISKMKSGIVGRLAQKASSKPKEDEVVVPPSKSVEDEFDIEELKKVANQK